MTHVGSLHWRCRCLQGRRSSRLWRGSKPDLVPHQRECSQTKRAFKKRTTHCISLSVKECSASVGQRTLLCASGQKVSCCVRRLFLWCLTNSCYPNDNNDFYCGEPHDSDPTAILWAFLYLRSPSPHQDCQWEIKLQLKNTNQISCCMNYVRSRTTKHQQHFRLKNIDMNFNVALTDCSRGEITNASKWA